MYLCSDENIEVSKEDINKVVTNLEVDGKTEQDNRAEFPRQLHRVSVVRDKVD